MKSLAYKAQLVLFVLSMFLFADRAASQTGPKEVLNGSDLTDGFDMGVNTNKGNTGWLTQLKGECFIMSFPTDQKWAAVFITYGEPKDPPRPSIDLSAYKTLSIEMKGASGGETVEIGIKSNTQADNGREKRVSIALTSKWEVYTFPLDSFTGADLKNLYVVAEFVYNGARPQTVYFRNIKYLTK